MPTGARQPAQPAARRELASSGSPDASRRQSLSRDRVIQSAITVLDAGGIDALTFRALALHLSTGAGAIYHYVQDKDDLLAAAASQVLHTALQAPQHAASVEDAAQSGAVRAVLLAAYNAVVARPWLGAQLSAAPWQPAVLQLLDAVGLCLDSLGVPAHAQFNAASLLVQHVLGVASQRAAAARLAQAGPLPDRAAFLAGATSQAASQTSEGGLGDRYPFLQRVSAQLSGHDDREQFLTGVDIILRGITTL